MLNLDMNYTLLVMVFVVGPCLVNGVIMAIRSTNKRG